MKKYCFTNETMTLARDFTTYHDNKFHKLSTKDSVSSDAYRVTLRRIKALIDIPFYDVEAGDLGGWIESEWNLKNTDELPAWVADDACVFEEAIVYGYANCEAQIYGKSRVFGTVSDNATVCGKSFVNPDAIVDNDSYVYNAEIVANSYNRH
ncbi:hypothetical protein IKF63_02705 [Candidatus Saccharibacteria bacterium]|nr:hypothetical protein [Candidatus Saccharibacteria bacterium]